MRWKTWVPLIAAIVLGLAAAKVAYNLVAHARSQASTAPQGVPVVVAARGVAVGDRLDRSDLRLARLDVGRAVPPAGMFSSSDQLIGRVATTAIASGQPVLESMLAPVGSGAGFQALVPTGMRAVTVEVTESSGVGGLLSPGCRVDVIATFDQRGKDETRSRVIVQGAQVAAVGRVFAVDASAATDAHKSVTLLVEPRSAEAIDLAATTGRVRLVLRSPADDAFAASPGMTLAELRGDRPRLPVGAAPAGGATADVMARLTQLEELVRAQADKPPVSDPDITPVAARPQPVRRTVEVIRGGAESSVTFEVADAASASAATETAGGGVEDDPFTRIPIEP